MTDPTPASMVAVDSELATAPSVGGPGGLAAKAAALSDRLRIDLAEALLDSEDPKRFRDAVAELANVMRTGKSSRARVRAAALLLTHAERVAEWSLPKAPAVAIQTNGPTTIQFRTHIQEGADGP